MFLDLVGDRSARWPQNDAYRNNVRRPIGNLLQALIESCQPEKCSWTYHAVALRPHQTVPNPKNVPGPIRGSIRSLAPDDAYPNNVRRPIRKSLQAPD